MRACGGRWHHVVILPGGETAGECYSRNIYLAAVVDGSAWFRTVADAADWLRRNPDGQVAIEEKLLYHSVYEY